MQTKTSGFSHIDPKGDPSMVNIGGKKITKRLAVARSVVAMPPQIIKFFNGNELETKKGPVFQTAKIAGIMAAKKTSELIPLCHPVIMEDCQIRINIENNENVVIECLVSTEGKTGVEMEALTGASIAALTIYDMCKAISHDIIIKETLLIEKRGGKNDFKRT